MSLPPFLQDLHQRAVTALGAARWGRTYYQKKYLEPDPWDYAASAYEQTKYRRTLAALSAHRYPRALELGCSEGVFTAELAQRCDLLVAVDFVGIALQRAQERCQELSNVHFLQMDVLQDSLVGRFNLITCGEVLYYLGGPTEISHLAARCADWLEPGGHLVVVNPWPAARRLHEPFRRHPLLQLREEQVETQGHRPYAIATFKRIIYPTSRA